QKENSKENSNSQTLDNNKTINNQNLNLKNINLSNSKNNLNNQSYLQNNAKQNSNNSDNDLNFNKNKSSSNSINQRDYDKEPIIIKDYKPQVNLIGIFFMILAFIMLCIARPEKVNSFTIVSLMVVIPYIMNFLGKNYFILQNKIISQIKNDKSFDFMQIKEIKNIKFNVDFRDGNEQIPLIAKILLLIIISTYIYAIFKFNEPIILFFIFMVIAVFYAIPKMITHIINGGKINDSIYNCLTIYDKNGKVMNIMICNDKEFNELKKYFLINVKLNISNAKTSFGIFNKKFYNPRRKR
ncbi:hypothetical protein, partial [Campylobacter hominis]